jgi:hypothetical protein
MPAETFRTSKPCPWNVTDQVCEEWRVVPSMPGARASSEGRIQGPRATSFGYVDREGYLLWDHKGRAFKVHRIVCEAFHGPPPTPQHHAAHLDGSKNNNRPENLVWATPKENMGHKHAHGTLLLGELHPLAKLTDEQVRYIWLSPLGSHRLAKELGVTKPTVQSIRTGKTWRHITDALPKIQRQAQFTRKPVPDGFREAVVLGASISALQAQFGLAASTTCRLRQRIRSGKQ